MTDEPRRIVIEKSSTVRRRYQRSNKQFRFTAAELKRIEREEELDRRAKSIRDKERKRIANKKKKDEQERERKRLGLPDPSARKVSSSQPLLSNFLGLARQPPPNPEPQTVQDNPDANIDSASGDTEVESDGPDDLDEEFESDLFCLQEAVIPEEVTEDGAINEQSEFKFSSPQHLVDHNKNDEYFAEDEKLEADLSNKKAVVLQESDKYGAGIEKDENEEDTDFFDDLDEELERDLFCAQDAGILQESAPTGITNDTSNESLALCSDRDDDEFSDCSAFDDEDILKAAETVVETPCLHPGTEASPPSKPALVLHPASSGCPRPITNTISSASGSFQDDTADYLEEVYARGCGDSFGEIF